MTLDELKRIREIYEAAEKKEGIYWQHAKLHLLPEALSKHAEFLLNAAEKVLTEQKELKL